MIDPRIARLIDANANRACEALRCLEDAARFGLDARELCASAKSLRHELRGAIAELGIDGAAMLAARDAARDVGTTLTEPGERTRAGLRGLVLAAGGRLGEARRAIEEAAKITGAESSRIEAIRYRGYDLQGAIARRFGAGRARQWAVCVILTGDLCGRLGWERVAERVVEGGADCIQIREKNLTDRELVQRARRVVEIAREAGVDGATGRGVEVVVNDRPDIALLVGADGVHVGQDDLDVSSVRRLVGDRLLIGVSTASMEQALAAVRAGADCCGCGPMYPSRTKSKDTIAGCGYLRAYLGDPETARVPHLAISGITLENVGELVGAGCRGVAVSGAVCSASDPEGLVRSLRAAIESGGDRAGASSV